MPRYIPNTEQDKAAMLAQIGLTKIEDLFTDIPVAMSRKRPLKIPAAMSELELIQHMSQLGKGNVDVEAYTSFLGAGAYDHFIPVTIDYLVGRQEFYTSYTPYQPEVSQGTLQAIYEYQTMICELTGMDAANASMYDAATAIAEAVAMACSATRRNEVLIAKSVHPESRAVVETYARFTDVKIIEIDFTNGQLDMEQLKATISNKTAAVIVQSPNFFGIIENMEPMAELAHQHRALLIASVDPISLAILKAPGELGADIVVGDGQSLGCSLQYGGPYFGFLATSTKLMRRIPGRIVGETTDRDGKIGYVLTLRAREQDIRRDKASSNICTNHALMALRGTVYMALMGKQGLREVAMQSAQKAQYAFKQLTEVAGFKPVFDAPFFKEFMIAKDDLCVAGLNERLLENKVLGGYQVGLSYPELKQAWLVACTEKRTKEDIDELVRLVVEEK